MKSNYFDLFQVAVTELATKDESNKQDAVSD